MENDWELLKEAMSMENICIQNDVTGESLVYNGSRWTLFSANVKYINTFYNFEEALKALTRR